MTVQFRFGKHREMINGSGWARYQVISYRGSVPDPVGDIIDGEISDTIIRTLGT